MNKISQTASRLDLAQDSLFLFGDEMAKIRPQPLETSRGRLVLVTAITPTKAGEGKTTTTIGLGDALSLRKQRVCLALREPSLGPCFGMKGGGTGGGKAQLSPSERINLHFTGDFHAITSAHNLISAVIDNHLHFRTALQIDARAVVWPRVIDMNDRALRQSTIGLGGKTNGIPRQANFDITAASELMAILCLTESEADLRERIERTLVAYSIGGEPVFAGQLGVTGAVMALLRDALMPNLVQTLEGTPALVHGGPFANIAHGCNSVLATKTALSLADVVVTEAGFGCDLGAEKFFHIKCRGAGLDPALVVMVASIRALKLHGGVSYDQLESPNPDAVKRGFANLEKHLENVRAFGKSAVVSLNRFSADSEQEIRALRQCCEGFGVRMAVAEHFAKGGEGALELADAVIQELDSAKTSDAFVPAYELSDTVEDKIGSLANKIYGASGVIFNKAARKDLKLIAKLGYQDLPVCMAKTQASISDDPALLGRPRDFELSVRGIQINSGAGFLVVLTGQMLRMPGLPRKPQAEAIDLKDGEILNLR